MDLSPDDFHFRIDLWDDENRLIEQVIAFVSDLEVARAAYAAAVQARPGKRITLRQRAFSIRASEKAKTPARGAFANVCGDNQARGEAWSIQSVCNKLRLKNAVPKVSRKGHSMWALVIFTIATTGPASSNVTSLEFAPQHYCLIAERQLESLTEPIVSAGLVRYEVVGTCVQVSEESKKK